MEIQFDENSMPDGQPKMKSAFGKSCNDLLSRMRTSPRTAIDIIK